ncbi:unnamed protein product [Closterium sp. Naga37s-1]|nr:unnamed protein product [Closterium sp. Naga37s-1]
MWVFDHAWNVIAEGMRNDGLYEMKLNEKVLAAEKATYQPPPKEGVMAREELKAKLKGVLVEELQVEAVAMVAAAAKVDLETLHRRLGHAGMERIKELVKKGMAAGVELKEGDGSKGRLPTKGLAADTTPHEAFYGRKPNMGFVRVWGCMAQYREPAGPDHKLLPRSKWGINLGMCKVSKGWVIKDVETGKMVVTRDVIFYENVNYLQWKGVNKEIAMGAAAVLDKVEKLLEEKEIEGIGSDDDAIGDDVEQPADGVLWALDSQDKRVVEEAAVMEKDGHQEVEHGETGAEEEDQCVELGDSSEGSAKGDEHDPWKLIESDSSSEAAKEIDELLEDGAMVLGKERGLDEIYAATKDVSKDESTAEEMGRGMR